MDVSRIELFCEEKNVGKICRLLMGLALEPPKILPVVNVDFAAGKLKPVTNGKLIALFVDWLKKKKIKTLTPDDLKNFVREQAGRPESAYVKLRADAQASGIIRKSGAGKQTRYAVAGGLLKQKRGK